jgi:C4-type Zn-finger protein
LEDLRDLVGSSRRKFVDWCAEHIPGYGGYKEKETRREADKMLRMHISKKLYNYRTDVLRVLETIVEEKRLEEINKVDKLSARIEILEDKIKYAEYGYSGFFDNVKVDEGVLDKIYEFDADLLQDINEMETEIEKLKEIVDDKDTFINEVEKLTHKLEDLDKHFETRKDVILEAS